MLSQILTELAFLHLGVGDEHLPQVFEQAGPAERAVGDGGAGHLRDGGHAEQLVLRVAGEGAHQLTWRTFKNYVTRRVKTCCFMKMAQSTCNAEIECMNRVPTSFPKSNSSTFQAFSRWIFKLFQHLQQL